MTNRSLTQLPNWLKGALLCATASAAAASAQEKAIPPTDVLPSAFVPAGRSQTSAFAEAATTTFAEPSAGPAEGESPFRWGAVGIDPHLSYGILYSDGILVSPGQPAATTRQDIAPGIRFLLIPSWSLDYTAAWERYSNPLFQNGLDQAALLKGESSPGDWTLQFSQNCTSSHEPLVETGRQTSEQDYATNIRALFGHDSRTLLELSLGQDFQISPQSPDSYEWSTLDWLHDPITPQWDAALGAGLAYIVMDPGYNMTAVRPEARITWQPADKFRLILQGGLESRAFIGSAGHKLTTPIFTGSLDYQLAEGTGLVAGARRDVEAGYSLHQVDDVTRLSIGLRQRLFGHFYLGAELGREAVNFVSVGGSSVDVRRDRTTTVQLSLSTILFRRLELSIQYSKLRNDSDIPEFGFVSNQYGATVEYRY